MIWGGYLCRLYVLMPVDYTDLSLIDSTDNLYYDRIVR